VLTHGSFLYEPDIAGDYQCVFLGTKISCLLLSRQALEFLFRDFGKVFISHVKKFQFLAAF